MQRVGARHRGGKVVADQVPGDSAEELPGCLQTPDHLLQLLAEGRLDETVPGMGQHHDQGPHRAPAADLLVLDEAHTAEVQFGHLPGSILSHPDSAASPAPPVAAEDEPVQG